MNGGTAVAQVQREDPELCIGRLIAFHSQAAPPPPDRLHPGESATASPAVPNSSVPTISLLAEVKARLQPRLWRTQEECWKISFKSEVSHSWQCPRAAMPWIGEVETAQILSISLLLHHQLAQPKEKLNPRSDHFRAGELLG